MKSLEEKLSAAFGEKKSKKTSKSNSSPMKDLAKRFNIGDDDFDDFKLAFSEAVKDTIND